MAMIDLDYAEKISDVIIKEVMGQSTEYDRSMVIDFDTKREHLIGEVVLKLWDKLLDSCKGYSTMSESRQSEKALACLIRKGVDRNRLKFRGTTAFVPMEALTYIIIKENPGFSCLPCIQTWRWTHPMSNTILLPEEDFADFLFEFDSYAGTVISKIDKRLLEIKALAMQFSIVSQTVNNLGEEYLRPNDISWNVESNLSDNSVTICFFQENTKSLREKVRLDELARVFPEIPGRMAKQPKLITLKPGSRPIYDSNFNLIPYDDV